MDHDLSARLKPNTLSQKEPKPIFFDLSKEAEQTALVDLLDANPQIKIIDRYEQQLQELFVLENPWLHLNPNQRDQEFVGYREAHYGAREPWQLGNWVFLEWRQVLLHLLDDKSHQKVRTARNRNLITAEEQEKYYNSTIGIAGLSVGNSCALAIVLTGGGKNLKLADPDTLELTNLNRIRGSIADLTAPKVYMTARQIYELDPYAKLTLYSDGLTEENIGDFFEELDVAVDEIDNIGMKVRIRQEAKKRKIPVVMAADNGDGGILDVERHDLETDIELFHGRAGKDIAERVVNKKLPLPVIGQIITEELLGAKLITSRMKKSLLEIGSTLPTWPQLGSAAILNGAAIATTVRKILTGEPVVDDRAVLSLESWLIPHYNEHEEVEKRDLETEEFLKKFHERLAHAPKPE